MAEDDGGSRWSVTMSSRDLGGICRASLDWQPRVTVATQNPGQPERLSLRATDDCWGCSYVSFNV